MRWRCWTLLMVCMLFAICSTVRASDSASPAKAFLRWEYGCLDGVEQDLESITESASAAATLSVHDHGRVAFAGDMGLWSETYGRSGGLMTLIHSMALTNPYWSGTVVYFLKETPEAIESAAEITPVLRRQDKVVIGVGRPSVVEQARAQGAVFDHVFNNHAAAHGGVIERPDRTWLLPTERLANAIWAWVWTGEYIAACTRLGKMPPVFQGYAVDGGVERAKRIGSMRWHPQTPPPMAPGIAGAAYLAQIRVQLASLWENEAEAIRTLAAQAMQARLRGGRLYVFLHSHLLMWNERDPVPHDPDIFEQINTSWFSTKPDLAFSSSDFLFCNGFDTVFEGPYEFGDWNDLASRAREAGVRLGWSLATYDAEEMAKLPEGEVLVDQQWAHGDAVVDIPGYDVDMLPSSGVMTATVYWLLNAEMMALEDDLLAVLDTPPTSTRAENAVREVASAWQSILAATVSEAALRLRPSAEAVAERCLQGDELGVDWTLQDEMWPRRGGIKRMLVHAAHLNFWRGALILSILPENEQTAVPYLKRLQQGGYKDVVLMSDERQAALFPDADTVAAHPVLAAIPEDVDGATLAILRDPLRRATAWLWLVEWMQACGRKGKWPELCQTQISAEEMATVRATAYPMFANLSQSDPAPGDATTATAQRMAALAEAQGLRTRAVNLGRQILSTRLRGGQVFLLLGDGMSSFQWTRPEGLLRDVQIINRDLWEDDSLWLSDAPPVTAQDLVCILGAPWRDSVKSRTVWDDCMKQLQDSDALIVNVPFADHEPALDNAPGIPLMTISQALGYSLTDAAYRQVLASATQRLNAPGQAMPNGHKEE